MTIDDEHARLRQLLPTHTQLRVKQLVSTFADRTRDTRTVHDVREVARGLIRLRFGQVDESASTVLAFCLISEALRQAQVSAPLNSPRSPSAGGSVSGNALVKTMSEASQMSQLDLQNSQQKQQQLLQTLSNIMKAVHDTTENIIQNLK